MLGTANALVRLSPRGRLVVGAWLLVMVANVVYIGMRPLDWSLDLRVYRAGGEAWLRDLPIYVDQFAASFGGPDLPFTYPPVAVLLFSLVAMAPLPVAIVAVAVANVVLLTLICLVAAVRVYGRGERALVWGLGVAAAVSVLDPLRETLWFGQINLILAGLVIADCLLARTWLLPRGTLIGLAAAIKLTPAVFALYWVARREWRPVVTSFVSFLVFGGLGFLIMPADAQRFWFHALLDPSRVGRLTYAGNQSLRGMLARLGLEGSAQIAVWALLCVAIVVLALLAAARAQDNLTAFLAIAVGGLLISPVSWGHHWVWIGPALVLLTAYRRRDVFWRVTVPIGLVFLIGPHWLFPRDNDVERNWEWWQQVIGNAYVWCGLAVLIALVFVPAATRGPKLSMPRA